MPHCLCFSRCMNLPVSIIHLPQPPPRSPQESPERPWPQEQPENPWPILTGASPQPPPGFNGGLIPKPVWLALGHCDPLGPQGQPGPLRPHSLQGYLGPPWITPAVGAAQGGLEIPRPPWFPQVPPQPH